MYTLILILTIILISIALFQIFPMESLAHRDGCHRWHSCPSDDGSYVCGDLGYDDECGGGGEYTEPANNDDNDYGRNNSNGDDIESSDLFTGYNNDNDSRDDDSNQEQGLSTSNECQGQADCFTGKVTEIVDGDTLDVNNVRVRLSLVNTPERGDSGYLEAKGFTESMCPIGSEALVDEDDGQKEGSFDRLIGLVYCGNEKLVLNEHLLNEGHAQIFEDFCNVSEFSEDGWVQKFGC
jgi:endonuclease YncB( thermonuclease family)